MLLDFCCNLFGQGKFVQEQGMLLVHVLDHTLIHVLNGLISSHLILDIMDEHVDVGHSEALLQLVVLDLEIRHAGVEPFLKFRLKLLISLGTDLLSHGTRPYFIRRLV